MAKQDVRHVDLHSTSDVADSPSALRGTEGTGDLPTPVVVTVPWLAPKSQLRATATEAIPPGAAAGVQDRRFQPESFVATIGLGVESLEAEWANGGCMGEAPQLAPIGEASQRRIREPRHVPQPRASSLAHPARVAPEGVPQTLQPAWGGGEAETHFRIDPPQSARNTPPTAASPQVAEPLTWQQQLVAIDAFLKGNGRLILLGAVMVATVFLLVVVSRGGNSASDPMDQVVPAPSTHIAPAKPEEIEPSEGIRQIDPPLVAQALGPEGLAIREDRDESIAAEPDITPIGPHFESKGTDQSNSSQGDERDALPYPSTHLPSWDGAEQTAVEKDPSNIAVIRSVRPIR